MIENRKMTKYEYEIILSDLGLYARDEKKRSDN